MSLRKAAADRGLKVKVSSGSPGQLQIFKDGTLVFDHKQAGDLPSTTELLRMLEG